MYLTIIYRHVLYDPVIPPLPSGIYVLTPLRYLENLWSPIAASAQKEAGNLLVGLWVQVYICTCRSFVATSFGLY